MPRRISSFLALILLGLGAAAHADDVNIAEPRLDPAIAAQLDALVAKDDWNGLGTALLPNNNPAFFFKSMDWLKVRVDEGGPYFLALLYSRDLWTAAGAVPGGDLRKTSALMLLYTLALVRIDGPACADATAPGHRFDQTLQIRADTLRYLKALPDDKKAQMVTLAMAVERHTAPLRRPHDEMLCRGGLAEMQAGIAAGREKEITPPAGMYGRAIGVSPPPDWKPSYKPEADYKPKQDQMRATLQDWLTAIAK